MRPTPAPHKIYDPPHATDATPRIPYATPPTPPSPPPPASGNTVNKQKICDPRIPYATPRIKLGMRAARVPNATPRITYATAQAALIQIDMPNV